MGKNYAGNMDVIRCWRKLCRECVCELALGMRQSKLCGMAFIKRWGPPVLAGFLLVLVWDIVVRLCEIPKWFFPAPMDVFQAAVREHKSLGRAILDTLLGASSGFFAAIVGGVGTAMLLASSRWLRSALFPWVTFMSMIPVVATSALFVLWLGAGWPSVTAITFVIGFFPIVASTTQGLLSTDRNQAELFRLYRATALQQMFLLKVPAALPYFFTGLQIAASLAIIGAITGELFAGSAAGTGGLGFLIIVFKSQLKTPELMATAFAACLFGFVFVGGVSLVRWVCLRQWHESAGRAD